MQAGAVMEETKCPGCKVYICDCVCPNVTGYSKKRRLLREHRKTMRVMEEVIASTFWFEAIYLQKLMETDAQNWDLDSNSELDETSDKEDPEAELKKENDKTLDFVQAAKDALDSEALRRDWERKSMMLEDKRLLNT